MRWNYGGLGELPSGEYVAILEILYAEGVRDEFRQEFEISKKRKAVDIWVLIVGGIVIGILIVSLVWYFGNWFGGVLLTKKFKK